MAVEGNAAASTGSRLSVEIFEALADSKKALQPVLAATPGWGQEAAAAATVHQISGALTNLVYRCTSPAAASNGTVIVRVFGRGSQLFSKEEERSTFLLAAKVELGPKCLLEYENGRVEEFLPGASLGCEEMRDPAVSAAIAAALAVFHVRMTASLPADQHPASVPANLLAAGGEQQGSGAGKLQAGIFERLRQWYAAAQQLCGEELAGLGLANLPDELDALEARLHQLYPSWLAFCHNDLLSGNILLFSDNSTADGNAGADMDRFADGSASLKDGKSKGGSNGDAAAAGPATAAAAASASAGGAAAEPDAPLTANGTAVATGGASVAAAPSSGGMWVKLIDYEYSTPNDVAFDLANHFCEWAYDYSADDAHTFHDDWLPSKEQQLHFCRAYVAVLQRQATAAAGAADAGTQLAHSILAAGAGSDKGGGSMAGNGGDAGISCAPEEGAVRLLQRKAQANMALSLLMWGLWGLVQHKTSDVDFDYLSFGRQRIERYHVAKRAVLEQQQEGS